eukprot:2685692-Rhodomonas_salina.1
MQRRRSTSGSSPPRSPPRGPGAEARDGSALSCCGVLEVKEWGVLTRETGEEQRGGKAVSYTHLTLPTICSV